MAKVNNRSHKHFQLDAAKLKRAQKALGANTETDAIELALDLVIAEDRKNRVLWRATERFLRSGIVINDVFGNLD